MASWNPTFFNDAPGLHERKASAPWHPQQHTSALTSNPSPDDAESLRSVRKRASFFGRSNSDASSMRRAPATAHSTKMSFSARMAESTSRPSTANSGEFRHRKTEPLQAIRESILGGKKKAAATRERVGSLASRPSSRGAQSVLDDAPARPYQYQNEDDYYRHLRKQSISPPFNFQHVTHTERDQLTRLETVDEKDLPGEFWSVAAHQRPHGRVHGIKVDNIDTRHRQVGWLGESPQTSPLSPHTTSLPQGSPLTMPEKSAAKISQLISPTSALSPLQSQTPDVAFDNDSIRVAPASPGVEHTRNYPKRLSSLNVLNQHAQRPAQQPSPERQSRPEELRSYGSFYDSNSSSESESRKQSPTKAFKPIAQRFPELNASMPPTLFQYSDVAMRSRQPLPSIPPQPAASRSSPNLLDVNDPPLQMLSPTLGPIKPLSLRSRRSSRSSRSLQSLRRSPVASQGSGDLRKSPSIPHATWEDDVDLAYEQEAESTCDFTWRSSTKMRDTTTLQKHTDGDYVASIYHAHSPASSTPNESALDLARTNSTDTIGDAEPNGPHKRGTSVGHRGFLAARKNSSATDLSAKTKEPPAPLTISRQSSARVSILSPVLSASGTDSGIPSKSPFTPAEQYPHLGRVSNDYLSDPESYRNSKSSKHRKSSSYGSYGSYDSASTRPSAAAASNASTTRWSVASSGSLPELMHSRPKSKSSLSRSVLSQPLETLPQSPLGSGTETEPQPIANIPRSSHMEPPRDNRLMRRPERASERMALESAGRAVQRGRPSSVARFSHHLGPPPAGGVRESWAAGPEWI